jgi:hypothetical protein
MMEFQIDNRMEFKIGNRMDLKLANNLESSMNIWGGLKMPSRRNLNFTIKKC